MYGVKNILDLKKRIRKLPLYDATIPSSSE